MVCLFLAGFVYLYHLPSEKAWKQLDLSKPSREIQLVKQHIHAVAIDDFGMGPYVAIATEDYCIHIVKFLNKKAEKIDVKQEKEDPELTSI